MIDENIMTLLKLFFMENNFDIKSVNIKKNYSYKESQLDSNESLITIKFNNENSFKISNINSINIDIFLDKYLLSIIYEEDLFTPDNYYESFIFKTKNELLQKLQIYFNIKNKEIE